MDLRFGFIFKSLSLCNKKYNKNYFNLGSGRVGKNLWIGGTSGLDRRERSSTGSNMQAVIKFLALDLVM